MGCCSECFNSNKKGEKDKEKNIQNMSISESTPKENTNKKINTNLKIVIHTKMIHFPMT